MKQIFVERANASQYCPSVGSSMNCSSTQLPNETGSVAAFVLMTVYGIICLVGLIGNSLVVYVITRFSKLQTVTNHYILNLSIADGVFLLGLPLVMTTTLIRRWLFGHALCKIYYMLTCVNMFTSSFTLTVMSGDRFLAVCFPFLAKRYRVPRNAIFVTCATWGLSFLAMSPIVMYARILPSPTRAGAHSCTIEWPIDGKSTAMRVYIAYTLLLGFVLPVLVISVFYSLVVVKLKSNATKCRDENRGRKMSRRKVTRLVAVVTGVYVVCWLPYWAFQVHLVSGLVRHIDQWKVTVFQVFTALSYANSAINPVLYAFTNNQFKESFKAACCCCSAEVAPPGNGGHRRESRKQDGHFVSTSREMIRHPQQTTVGRSIATDETSISP